MGLTYEYHVSGNGRTVLRCSQLLAYSFTIDPLLSSAAIRGQLLPCNSVH